MKKNLSILFSIIILSVFIGLGARLVFAQIGWEEPTDTPPYDNEIPLWIKNGNNLYHTTGGWAGFLTNDPKGTIHLSGGQTWGTDLNLDSTTLSGGRRWLLISTGGNASEGQGKFLIKDNNANAVRLTIDTSGNVTIPGVLTVGSCIGCGGSQWATSGSNIYNTNSGAVGIGTSSPLGKLHVMINSTDKYPAIFASINGTAGPNGGYGVFGRSNFIGVGGMGDGPFSFGGYFSRGTSGQGQGLYADTICLGTTTDCKTAWSQVSGASDWSAITNKPAGFADNVDNDTTYSAGTNLSLSGTTFNVVSSPSFAGVTTAITSTSGTNYGLNASATGSGATANIGGSFNASGASINQAIKITGPSAGSFNYAIYSGSSAQSYFAGNVGIGTTSPAYKLDVSGDVRITGNTTLGNASSDTTTVNGSMILANTGTVASSEVTSTKPDNYLKIKVNGTDYAIPLYFFGWLVNNKHTVGDCINAGGAVVNNFCKFTNNVFTGFSTVNSAGVCPSGWSRYSNWTQANGTKCTGNSFSGCTSPTSCTTGSHSWQDKAEETCTYESKGWKLTGCTSSTKTCYAWDSQIGCY